MNSLLLIINKARHLVPKWLCYILLLSPHFFAECHLLKVSSHAQWLMYCSLPRKGGEAWGTWYPAKALTAELSVKFLQVTKGYKRGSSLVQPGHKPKQAWRVWLAPSPGPVSDLGFAGQARLLPLALCGTSGSRNLDRVVETSPTETATASFLPMLSCDSKQILLHFFKRGSTLTRETHKNRSQQGNSDSPIQKKVSEQLVCSESRQGRGHGEPKGMKGWFLHPWGKW